MIVVVLVFGAGLAILVGLAVQRRWQRSRVFGQRLLISYATILLMLAAGELYFRYIYVGMDSTLGTERWLARYWHENALGYRDREWQDADSRGKSTVSIVGDSLTAGWGIEDPQDRFSSILADHLGDDYAVFNLGMPGATTPQELEALRTAPDSTPDVVILQYFLNDIEYAVLSLGLPIQHPNIPPLAAESALANFVYTRFQGGFDQDYWDTEYGSYDNYAIWGVHEQEIDDFIDYVESINARLIVVIFPNLQDPVRSIAYVDRVAQVFEARGQQNILKLSDEVATWSPADVIVSPRDGHPSAAFHHRVGDLLYERYFAPEPNP